MGDRVRVGVVGVGYGRTHVRAFKAHPRAEVTALCCTDVARAAPIAAELGVPQAYGSYQAMLENAPIDAVSITAPAEQHVGMVAAAFDAGKHVVCVKPLANTLADSYALLQRSRDSGLVHAIDLQGRLAPATRYAKELLDSGAIGRPVSALTSMHMSIPFYLGLPTSSPNKAAWYLSGERGGGFFMADTPHQFDRMMWYFGPVRSVAGRIRLVLPEVVLANGTVVHSSAPDSYHALLEFESGLVAVVFFTPGGMALPGRRFEAHGEGGSILLEGTWWDETVKLGGPGDRGYVEKPIPDSMIDRSLPEGINAAVYAIADRFLRAVLDGEPMSPSFEDGYRVQEVVEAVVRADATGQRQLLPLVPEEAPAPRAG